MESTQLSESSIQEIAAQDSLTEIGKGLITNSKYFTNSSNVQSITFQIMNVGGI